MQNTQRTRKIKNEQIIQLINELNRQFSKETQMGNKHIKSTCSISLAIKEMQIKATLRLYLIPDRMAIIINNINNKCWQGYGEKEPS
jgi:hypothetical protein